MLVLCVAQWLTNYPVLSQNVLLISQNPNPINTCSCLLDMFGHVKKETTNKIISGGIFDGGLENGSYSSYIFANVCLEVLQELLFINIHLEMSPGRVLPYITYTGMCCPTG